MGERRGVDERRGSMRELQKEARGEFERIQQHDTGGQEHASRADREGVPAGQRADAGEGGRADATPEQSDAEKLRVPRGEAVTGGGGNVTRGPTPAGRGEPEDT